MEEAKELAIAVIRQAFRDLEVYEHRRKAQRFIRSKDFEYWVGVVGADTHFLREEARKIKLNYSA